MSFWKTFGKTSRFLLVLVLPVIWSSVFAQTPPTPPGSQAWPRQFQTGTTAFTVYQPQLESWQWRNLSGRVAVSVKDAASPQEQFGVVWFTAQTNVNRAANLVTLDDITLTKANFPASPDNADQYLQALRSVAPAQMADLSFCMTSRLGSMWKRLHRSPSTAT